MKSSASRDRIKLEMKRAAVPFFLYVMLCIAGLLTTADVIRNLSGDKPWITYSSYRASFTDVKNVLPGRVELRLAGVKVGSIVDTSLVDGRPVLTLHLEQQYAPIYRDAVLRIRPVSPLEDMYVDIVSRGHPSAGVLRSSEILPTTQTTSPVEISSVLDLLDSGTRTRLGPLLNQLGRGLRDGGAQLRAGFEAIAPFLVVTKQTMAALAERHAELPRLVHNFGGIAQELALRDTQLTSFIQAADATLGALARSNQPFAATISQLPPTLASMNSAFAKLRAAESSLDPALTALGPVADRLPAGLDALSSFSQDATPALRALRKPLRDLKPLSQILRPTSRSLAGAFTQLQPEALQFDRTTQIAATPTCLTYIGQFLNQVISMTKFGDTAQNVANARAHVSVSFTSPGAFTHDPAFHITPLCFK
jgi:ABC-type transporter Mla subunit MlaD